MRIKSKGIRIIAFTVILLVSTLTGFGQTLFFDNLNHSVWTSDPTIDTTVWKQKEIHLLKLNVSKDSLRFNRTVWTFNDGSLTITYRDNQLKTESLIGIYAYEISENENVLKIRRSDGRSFEYLAGITSVGSSATLYKRKEKKRK